MANKKRPNGDFKLKARSKSQLWQNNRPNQWRGTLTWLGKLVEKGWGILTKSFWDAFFDHILPK